MGTNAAATADAVAEVDVAAEADDVAAVLAVAVEELPLAGAELPQPARAPITARPIAAPARLVP